MRLKEMELKSNLHNYKVYFAENDDFIAKLHETANAVFIIDENVWNLHSGTTLSKIKESNVILLEINEDKKNIDTVQDLYDKVMKFSPKKNMNVISIGGGITQDISGFLASTLYRGVNWIYIPTTLLAQADSCIGAKTSLNYRHYKNLIGTFYPPKEIWIYTGFLKTLNEIDFFSGLGEIGKLHMNGGEKEINRFTEAIGAILNHDDKILLNAIENSLMIKKSYIEDDEFDTGKRNMLNFGHCFGHAVESATDFAIPHGQAVVIGIMLANIAARNRNLLSAGKQSFLYDRLLSPILKINFNKHSYKSGEFAARIIECMKQDKKRVGSGLPLIVIDDNYNMQKLTDIREDEIRTALNTL